VVLLQEMALAMQDHPEGMRISVSKRWAAETIAAEWKGGVVDKDSIAAAEAFLAAEEVDSGIIVGGGQCVLLASHFSGVPGGTCYRRTP